MKQDLPGQLRIIYQSGHRGFVAIEGGITDAPYTYMNDLQNGTYRLPWEDQIVYKDGQEYGFNPPRTNKVTKQ